MKKPVTVFDAIKSLRPYAEFGLSNDDYGTLQWFDDPTVITIPTKEEVDAEVARLLSEYQNNEYRRLRAPEYPSIGDQLDALFHAGVFPADMAARLQAVKDKYPKGQA